MDDTTTPADRPQYLADLWVTSKNAVYRWLDTCPHAQTLRGWSTVENCEIYIPLTCKQWSCRTCAETKIRIMAARTREAKPTRMLTLTLDPQQYKTPREAYDHSRRQIPELFKYLRTKFGEIEYLRVTELTRDGWPHYHFLLRSGYIPHAAIRFKWNELTKAIIVDIRPVQKSFAAYTYLVKYLSKIHSIPWTDRHLSYSRNFFPPEDPKQKNLLGLEMTETIPMHPATVIYREGEGAVWRKIGSKAFALVTLNPDFNDPAAATLLTPAQLDDW